jgi:aspartate/methionine/tyrosine aminotransferase
MHALRAAILRREEKGLRGTRCLLPGATRQKQKRGINAMPILSERVQSFTDSVIRRMTRISDEHGAINLSQGFPDFDPPKEIMDALAKAAYEGPHQYSVTFGAENFREALAQKQGRAIGRKIDPETEIVVTCGGTEAMMCAMMTICNPGDKVLVFSPFYENYGADAILSGADPIYVPLVPPEYNFDLGLVEEGFAGGAKAIIVCNPSNPCGKVFSREELMAIGELAVKYDAFVVTDEVYEHMVYAPYHHTCMASLPGMYEHTITCNSLSKTYSITGWRLGYLIGPKEVIEGAKKVHDFLTVGAAAPLQEAAVTGLMFPQSYYDRLLETYTKKRDYFLAGLDRIGLKHNVPQGTYFVLIDIQEFLDLPQFAGYTDLEFCEWMIRNVGVAAVPGSSFFKEEVNNLIRLHFAREEATIDEAVSRLGKLQELLKVGK